MVGDVLAAAAATGVLMALKKHWVMILSLGVLMIVLGILGLNQPMAYTVATVVFFGAVLLVIGGAGIVTAFKLEGWSGRVGAILLALLYAITGVLLLMHPVLGALTLTLLVAAFLFAGGLVRIWMGFTHRAQGGGFWVIVSGLLSIVLGYLIYSSFPGSGVWVLGLFLAIQLLFDGWALVLLALAARRE
jgi:uncharacterized membrane protein HdeD (DUF308 family)